jgi:3'(2'), 5'-bisphosphate nucleotidase
MLDSERDFAVETVRRAVQICRMVQGQIVPGRWDKDDRTPVTVADLAVQAVVSAALHERFPSDPLMGEEESRELREPKWADLLTAVAEHVHVVRSERAGPATILDWIERGQQAIDSARRYWVLDPVDGTKGFLRKEQYAIALALVERGDVMLGVLACPNLPPSFSNSSANRKSLGQLYVAVRGEGAECCELGPGDAIVSRRPIRVDPVADPGLAEWCERVESSDRNHDVTAQVVERVGITAAPRRIDSQAKYAVVARGDAALYLRHSLGPYIEKSWDHAAGALITQEAGGRVSDVDGLPLDFSRGRQLERNRGIVATNGVLHERVLAAVREVLGTHSNRSDDRTR